MQRAVVAIGINKTGGLPELQAARKSAEAFADWARKHQGIPAKHIKLITDAKSAVGRERIYKAIEKFANLGYIEQLIVYFSGHGINSGHYEQWLLSRAPDDPAAAVNVRGSEMLARSCGIRHVIMISDACRTAADSIQAQGVTGGEIFPNSKSHGVENPVDQYFATLVGNPAFEVRSSADAANGYSAAYSRVMLEALSGNVSSLVESRDGQQVIRPRPLKRYLSVAVPEFLQSLHLPGRETQQPDARIESDDTAWIAELSASSGKPVLDLDGPATPRKKAGKPFRPAPRDPSDDLALPPPEVLRTARGASDLILDAKAELNAALHPKQLSPKRGFETRAGMTSGSGSSNRLFARAVSRGSAGFGPDHFETQCGIKLRGTRLAAAWSWQAHVALGDRGDVVQVNLHDSRKGANVLVQLNDGSLVIVPAFRDYITSLSFDDDGNLEDVSCEPSANTPRYAAWKASSRELGNLRAVVAAASSLGVFRFDDAEQGIELLNRMRSAKSLDPMIAVYAAWAFHDRRMRAQIVDMQTLLDDDLNVRLFDVAMLSLSLGKKKTADTPKEMYPCVPMLTQGWSLLMPLNVKLPDELMGLRGNLRPTLWTQFSPVALDPLLKHLQKQ